MAKQPRKEAETATEEPVAVINPVPAPEADLKPVKRDPVETEYRPGLKRIDF